MRLANSTIAFLLAATPALAWDYAGHMLVGQIAWEHSQPATRAAVDKLAVGLDRRFSPAHPYNFVTAGCWMDDMRALNKAYLWSKWHYVTEPWTPDGSAFTVPEPPHAISAVEESLQTLRNPQAAEPARIEALGFLIHLTGDLHQPMHATDRGDRGGNGTFVTGVPFRNHLRPNSPLNLHFFWDAAYRAGVKDGQSVELWRGPEIGNRPLPGTEGIIATEAGKIMGEFPKAAFAGELEAGPGNAETWARESHLLGCRQGYPPGAEPSDTQVYPLPVEFVGQSREVAVRRVALAGYRLAMLLDGLFGEK